MSDSGKHRILIADDHPLYRDALVNLFLRSKDFEVCAAVSSLDEALEALKANADCALALLDLGMPGMGGLSGVDRVRAAYPGLRIAIISGQLDATSVRAALNHGASGCLPKTFDPPMILAALRLMLTGASYVPHELIATPANRGADAPGAEADPGMTPRELEVLALLAHGTPNKEIARDLGLAEVTVKLHVRRILQKLNVRNRSAAVAAAIRQGLVKLDAPVL